MGEFANYLGQRVKIGTCEELFYLRAEQEGDIVPLERGSLDHERVRFRFPWPDEDGTAPGAYMDHDRSLRLEGIEPPEELADEHSIVQFSARNGYLANLPCPESGRKVYTMGECGPGAPNGLRPVTVHRNGYGGAVHLVAQRWLGDDLVPVVRCGGCRIPWRLPTLADVQPALDRMGPNSEIARRIRAGYTNGGAA